MNLILEIFKLFVELGPVLHSSHHDRAKQEDVCNHDGHHERCFKVRNIDLEKEVLIRNADKVNKNE